MTRRILIAGIGNIFLGDDGFGVELARRLARVELPDCVRVADYGISGMHLAFDLLAGYDMTIMLDATARGDEPGTVYVVELDPPAENRAHHMIDAHAMHPGTVLELLSTLGGNPGRVLLVGCEPAVLEHHIGLSPVVTAAVDVAAAAVLDLVERILLPETEEV